MSQHLFKYKHFESEIILLCVRWYLKYPLSYRMLVEMMQERGLKLTHTTIMRWVLQSLQIFHISCCSCQFFYPFSINSSFLNSIIFSSKPKFYRTIMATIFSKLIAVRTKLPIAVVAGVMVDGRIFSIAFIWIFIPPDISAAIRAKLFSPATLLLPDIFFTLQA